MSIKSLQQKQLTQNGGMLRSGTDQSNPDFVPIRELLASGEGQAHASKNQGTGFVPIRELLSHGVSQASVSGQNPSDSGFVPIRKLLSPSTQQRPGTNAVTEEYFNNYIDGASKYISWAMEDESIGSWEYNSNPFTLKERSTQLTDLKQKSSNIRKWYEENKQYFDEDEYSQNISYLDFIEQQLDAAYSVYDTAGNYQSQAEYTVARNWAQWQQQYMAPEMAGSIAKVQGLIANGASPKEIEMANYELMHSAQGIDTGFVYNRLSELDTTIQIAKGKGEDTYSLEQEQAYLMTYYTSVSYYQLRQRYMSETFLNDLSALNKLQSSGADQKEIDQTVSSLQNKAANFNLVELKLQIEKLEAAIESGYYPGSSAALAQTDLEILQNYYDNAFHFMLWGKYKGTTYNERQQNIQYLEDAAWALRPRNEETWNGRPDAKAKDYNESYKSIWSNSGRTPSMLQDEANWLKEYSESLMSTEERIAENNKELDRLYKDIDTWENVFDYYSADSVGRVGNEIRYAYGEEYAQWKEANLKSIAMGSIGLTDFLKAKAHALETQNKYGFLHENEDFTNNSQYNASVSSTEFLYHVIGNASLADSPMGAAYGKYLEMTNDEKAIYFYLYNTKGEDAADEFLSDINIYLEGRFSQTWSGSVDSFIAEYPLLGLFSVPVDWIGSGLLSSLEYTPKALWRWGKGIVTGEEQDPVEISTFGLAAGSLGSNMSSATTKYIQENFDGSTATLLEGGYSLYNIAVEMVIQYFVGKGLGAAGLGKSAAIAITNLITSNSAYMNTVLDVRARGGSDDQALASGLAAGLFEWLFENYELSKLIEADSSFIRSIFKNAFSEGMGEGATTAANALADIVIMADKSHYNLSVQQYKDQYIAQGMSPEEAEHQAQKDAWIDIGKNIGADAFMGALGGGLFGSVKFAFSAAKTKSTFGSHSDSLVNQILKENPGDKTALQAREHLDSGKKLTGSMLSTLIEKYPNVAINVLNGHARRANGEFVGESGTHWNSEQGQLLEAIPDSVLAETDKKLGKAALTFDIIGLQDDPEAQKAWKDAGLTWEQLGTTYVKIEALRDEINWRVKNVWENGKAPNATQEVVKWAESAFKRGEMTQEQLDGVKQAAKEHEAARVPRAYNPDLRDAPAGRGATAFKADIPSATTPGVPAPDHVSSQDTTGPATDVTAEPAASMVPGSDTTMQAEGTGDPSPTEDGTFVPSDKPGKVRLKDPFVNAPKSLFEMAQRISEITGREIVLFRENPGKHGIHDGYEQNGVLHINVLGADPVATIWGHEYCHSFENTKEHESLKKGLRKLFLRKGIDMKAQMDAKQKFYKRNGVDIPMDGAGRVRLENEVVAAYTSKLFTTEADIKAMVEFNPTIIQRMRHWVDSVLAAFGKKNAAERNFLYQAKKLYQKALSGGTALKNQAEHRDTSAEFNARRQELETMLADGQITDEEYENGIAALDEEQLLQIGRTESRQTKTKPPARQTTPTDGAKHLIVQQSNGQKFVRADRQVIFGNDPDSWSEQVEDYINGKIRRGQDVRLITEDGQDLLLTSKTAGKMGDNHTSYGTTLSDADFSVKANAAVHIDELAAVSSPISNRTVKDYNDRHGDFADKGWKYRKAFFLDFDGKYYKLTISTAMGSNGNIVYNIGKIEERSFPFISGSSVMDGAEKEKTSFKDRVPQEKPKVKSEKQANHSFNPVESAAEDAVTETGEVSDAAEAVVSRETLNTKARNYLRAAENRLLTEISKALSVPRGRSMEFLRPVIQQISDEYLKNGTVSQEAMDDLFKQAYDLGIVQDREFYDQYKHIKDHLRTTAVTLSKQDQADIADFKDFRSRARNMLRIKDEGGTPVDVAYIELNDMAPELFPESITHPADQLQRMFDVADSIRISEQSLDAAYGHDPDFKKWAKHEFEAAVAESMGKLRDIVRYASDGMRKPAEKITTAEQAVEAWGKLKKARRTADKAMSKNLLTESDQQKVNRLLRGEISLENLDPEKDNVKGITAVYEAKQEYEELSRQLDSYKRSIRAKNRSLAERYLGTVEKWKDKKGGLAYARETMWRNIQDIVPDPALARKINEEYFFSVNRSEAKSTKFKNDFRNRVRKLDLSRKVEKGNLVSEAHAVQLYGEALDNIRILQANKALKSRDGLTLSEWQATIQKLWAENPNLDQSKIKNAVEEFRKIYDELFSMMNEVRVRNGYEPVNYRQGYFPHFQPGEESVIAQFGKVFGIEQVDVLPTTINGLTHMFKPGTQWFGNTLERIGFATAYDAVEGFDRYIEGIAGVIHQTDNIQKLRALASQIRYMASDDGVREQVDKVMADDRLTDEDKQVQVAAIYEKSPFALSKFVEELDEYTNLLANKKSRYDRPVEALFNRKFYNFMRKWEGRVAANMVGGNLGSALTNFIPLTQAWGRLSTKNMLKGMFGTLKTIAAGDGIESMSDFLTNRRGSDPLVRNWIQKTSNALGKPMELIDSFTSGAIVRAAYYQYKANGMSDAEAIHQADQLAASVMADRSKGAMPTIFSSHNPFIKNFTQFQLEVNNQISEVFKDLPRAYRGQKLALTGALTKYFIGAWLFNLLFQLIAGRKPALDPIDMLWELGTDIADGKKAGDVYDGFKSRVLESLPFSSGLTLFGFDVGDSRLPVSSSIPNLKKMVSSWDNFAKEGQKVLTYNLPTGGGGQLAKTYKGVKAFVEGGSYGKDAKGNDVLQYPIYKDSTGDFILNLARSVIFGKNSTEEAQVWVDSGFKSLPARYTNVYQALLDAGIKDRDAYKTVNDFRAITGEDASSKKRQFVLDSNLNNDAKEILVALTFTDTELETKAGNPSSYAKYRQCLDYGITVDEYLQMRQDGGDVDHFLKFADADLEASTCSKLAVAIGKLKPEKGKKQVSNQQKWRTVIQNVEEPEQQMAALSTMMSDSQYAKCSVACDNDLDPDLWVVMQEVLPMYDKDENGAYNQEEITKAIDAVGGDLGARAVAGWWGMDIAKGYRHMSKKEKAVLWQLLTGAKSAENNPYDVKAGDKALKKYTKLLDDLEDDE